MEDFLAAAAPRATIGIDPNVRPLLVRPDVHRARLAHWCGLADVLRVSADDLELLLPDTPHDQACDIWHADWGAARGDHARR